MNIEYLIITMGGDTIFLITPLTLSQWVSYIHISYVRMEPVKLSPWMRLMVSWQMCNRRKISCKFVISNQHHYDHLRLRTNNPLWWSQIYVIFLDSSPCSWQSVSQAFATKTFRCTTVITASQEPFTNWFQVFPAIGSTRWSGGRPGNICNFKLNVTSSADEPLGNGVGAVVIPAIHKRSSIIMFIHIVLKGHIVCWRSFPVERYQVDPGQRIPMAYWSGITTRGRDFNLPILCVHISITHRRNLCKNPTSWEATDLCVLFESTITINQNWRWTEHIDTTFWNLSISWLSYKRNVGHCPQRFRLAACQPLVWLKQEYCSTVWCPTYQNQIRKIGCSIKGCLFRDGRLQKKKSSGSKMIG